MLLNNCHFKDFLTLNHQRCDFLSGSMQGFKQRRINTQELPPYLLKMCITHNISNKTSGIDLQLPVTIPGWTSCLETALWRVVARTIQMHTEAQRPLLWKVWEAGSGPQTPLHDEKCQNMVVAPLLVGGKAGCPWGWVQVPGSILPTPLGNQHPWTRGFYSLRPFLLKTQEPTAP